MNAKAFISAYIMHDSLIDNIEIADIDSRIVMWIDFAFWMQNGYNEADPETGILKITFSEVSSYTIPEDVEWNAISMGWTRASISSRRLNCLLERYCSYSVSTLTHGE